MTDFQQSIRISGRILSLVVLSTSLFSTSVSYANPRIAVDVQSLKIVEEEDSFHKWYPASLTKLMTAYTVFRAIDAGQITLDSPVTMTKAAVSQIPSKMPFKKGDKLTLDNALKIMLVKSANDVAVAIAETVGGSVPSFVDRMNAEAARIGMSSSHFINPNGLPGKGQYTTARDLALLAVLIKREYPQYASYFSLEGFTTGNHNYTNYNLLIGRFDGADGMKTGFICASGFNQVASATRNGRTIVSVVLGTESLGARADESARLLQAGLTGQFAGQGTLASLKPAAGTPDAVADISKDICSAKGAKQRSEGRDEVGRMKLLSPFVHEMVRTPNFVFAGLLPKEQADVKKAGSASNDDNVFANVPVPTPRPNL